MKKKILLNCLLSCICLSSMAQLPDYSYCGYKASNDTLPWVETKVYVPFIAGDATAYIQAAIDAVAALPLDQQGFRGAVQLAPGSFQIEGSLYLRASGVVLRGSGCGPQGTQLVGAGQDRSVLIRVAGRQDRSLSTKVFASKPVALGDAFISVSDAAAYQPGDDLLISRWATKAWVDAMDMNDFGGESSYIAWKLGDKNRPSDAEVRWERQIVDIKADTLFLDAPLTCAMSTEEAMIQVQTWPGRLSQSAVENLQLISTYDKKQPKDENHRWNAIEIDAAQDVWVRNVQFSHFAGSAVFVSDYVRRVTVQDCASYNPVSEIGGSRRYTFHTLGGQTLFLRCYSEQGFHDFSTGHLAPGPNAFVYCRAKDSHHMSGAVAAWATGLLFDNFQGNNTLLSFANRGQDNMGAGWTAGNSTMWRCSTAVLANPNPPTAQNWSYASQGKCVGDAEIVASLSQPESLFFAQLEARGPLSQAQMSPRDLPLTTPDKEHLSWIKNYKKQLKQSKQEAPSLMHLRDGLLVKNDAVLSGRSQGVVWWNGSLKARYLATNSRPHITRWVPGRTGEGFTDNLDEMTDKMQAQGVLITNHHYGLWYDRRRDDHERIRRMDGYVWAPFYEQPFARSGQGVAYDGLSKYDLTQWNVWYWNRLKHYADQADEKGLVLYHQHFFQHNIIEAGAHWADSPWRTANNINDMGFPEPVPYAGDKRVFMSEHFYDVSHEGRRALYRNYIRKSLDEFADNGSVIHFISEEYTGPLHFVQFWLDVIAEWEAETGKDAKVALSCTKDVQDAVLADEQRVKTVDIIDIKYWNPTMDGFYAPPGGKHLAPRQFGRLPRKNFIVQAEVKARNAQERDYEVVADYRQRFPDKAVIVSVPCDAWATFMAGASLCQLPWQLPQAFKQTAAHLQKMENPQAMQRGKVGKGYIVYAPQSEQLSIDLSKDKKTYHAQWIHPRSGMPQGEVFKLKGGKQMSFENKGILWLYK